MNRQFILSAELVLVALLFFTGCHSTSRPARTSSRMHLNVVVAARDLGQGHVIEQNDIKAARLLATSLPDDIIMDRDLTSVPGATLLQAVKAGRPVIKSKLKDLKPKAKESGPKLGDMDFDGT